MQIRPKAYLHFISRWRSHRDTLPPHHSDVRDRASPTLIYATVVLAFLLAVLEIDAHRLELEQLGLLSGNHPVQVGLFSP
ncbi:hypothetical protein [Bradyrhizobium sp. ORS 86]|uniref:hypothetical protein n=1 Tax=Bradyrhizobium sp. ORS 86 TaxID=1685970 RepID=UPI00389056EB